MNETLIIPIFGIISYVFMGFLFFYLYKDSKLKYLLELSFVWHCCSCIFLVDIIIEVFLLEKKYFLIEDIITCICCFLLIKAVYTFIKVKLLNLYKHIRSVYVIITLVIFIIGTILFKGVVINACVLSSIITSSLFIIFENLIKERFSLKKYTIGTLYIIVGSVSMIVSMVKQVSGIWDTWTFVSIISILVIGIGFILSYYEKLKEQLRYIAYHDSLTGLLSKKMFVDKLNLEIEKSKKYNKKFALFCIDFDNFKLVNDTLRHDSGDEVLKDISNELMDCIGKYDLVSRFGGDEFSILQRDVHDLDEVICLVDKILKKFKKPISVDNYIFDITASVGIVMFPKDAKSCCELLKKSDIAMYKAKGNGKNQYKFFESYMDEELEERMYMQKKLKEAVKENVFSVYYQPQIDIRKGKISGVEALIRWVDCKEGMILPKKFIPLAEETGFIIQISEFVLKTACSKVKKWNTLRECKLTVSINISVSDLNQKNFVEMIKKILKETGLEPEFLVLEITESILIKSLKNNIKKLEELKKIGVKVALDDFGKGYSSLSYLMNLPIDILKIDKSFVDDITKDLKKQYIINTIISLAQKIDLEVVAEGVEFKEQYEILKKQNCDKIQGYYFSKPLSEETFEDLYMTYKK